MRPLVRVTPHVAGGAPTPDAELAVCETGQACEHVGGRMRRRTVGMTSCLAASSVCVAWETSRIGGCDFD